MSSDRSNSAVRNLRSIFENKASENSPNTRGRSPGSLGVDLDTQQRPTSKVRASFIAVEPTMAALAAEQSGGENELKRVSSAGGRRASFNESRSEEAIKEMKDAVRKESSVAETIPETAVESAAATPAVEIIKELGGAISKVEKEDKEAAYPEMQVTGVEEDLIDMKLVDPAGENAVSGGEALPPVSEDLRKTTSKATKPNSISVKHAKAAPSSIKSPSQPKTPVSASSAAPSKKPSRSSLTAPTAASVARQAAADKQTATTAKPKPREASKPLDVSSRLTAPTAASRARLESATSAPAQAVKPAAASKSKPATTSRLTPRASLAGRPESQSSSKSTAPVDGGFLDRMTRPTAASSNRVHEKTEVKSPPRQKQLPLRPKTNGALKAKPSTSATTTVATEPVADTTMVEDAPALPEHDRQDAEEGAIAEIAEPELEAEEVAESDSNIQQEQPAAAESTPDAAKDE